MSVYTEDDLKNKLIEKLEAVHVVSEIAARTRWRLQETR